MSEISVLAQPLSKRSFICLLDTDTTPLDWLSVPRKHRNTKRVNLMSWWPPLIGYIPVCVINTLMKWFWKEMLTLHWYLCLLWWRVDSGHVTCCEKVCVCEHVCEDTLPWIKSLVSWKDVDDCKWVFWRSFMLYHNTPMLSCFSVCFCSVPLSTPSRGLSSSLLSQWQF